MKAVWKFPIQVADEQIINIPLGATLLTVQVCRGEVCIWALVDTAEKPSSVKIITHGTGHPADDVWNAANYIGTYQIQQGEFVGHVWVLRG